MANRLREIEALGQSIWIDTLNRELLDDCLLRVLIEDDGISGVTSHPAIFEHGLGDANGYERGLRTAAEGNDPRQLLERLVHADVRAAADVLHPIYERTEGRDGFVSLELPASLADDVPGSVEAALCQREEIDRPNVMIKVPGTPAGVRVCEELTACGVSVNVSLLFSVSRYVQVAEAYLRGLERRVDAGEDVESSGSVASFAVSGVDARIDAALERVGRPELRGGGAIANAKLAYAAFQEVFSGERWERLASTGADVQRLLWVSVSPTADPDRPDQLDMLYVDELIGAHTVSTMPFALIAAAREHATPARSVNRDISWARAHMEAVHAAGVDVDDILLRQLPEEGVDALARSHESLLETVGVKLWREVGV